MLRSSRFEELARAVDVIVHCGAWVNSLLSYASLYKSNVVGKSVHHEPDWTPFKLAHTFITQARKTCYGLRSPEIVSPQCTISRA